MTSKLVSANRDASMVLRSVTPNILTASSPFYRFGRIKMGGRGTVVKMTSGALAVFSPTALTPAVRSEVSRMGDRVSYIAALDFEHHIFISEWVKAFPDAAIIGVEGLPEKREKDPATAGSNFKYVFTNSNKDTLKLGEEFDRDFDYEYIGGHANKELVFLYKPEKTLIQADLIFNLPAYEQHSKEAGGAEEGWLTKLFIGLNNTRGDATWQKRFIWYIASSGNRTEFNKSVQRINGWDFNRIIPCHGDVIETGGKGIFQKVLANHLNAQKKDT